MDQFGIDYLHSLQMIGRCAMQTSNKLSRNESAQGRASGKLKEDAPILQATAVMEFAPEATLQQLREFLALLNRKCGCSFESTDLMRFSHMLLQTRLTNAEVTLVSLS